MDEHSLDDGLYQNLLDCVDSLSSPRTLCWDSLPELDLYMDQVIVFMEKRLALFGDGRDKLVTPSMINNYVKLGLIPPPVKKKYSREHLSRLTVICMLKSLLPIPVISYLTDTYAQASGLPGAFDQFIQTQQEALQSAARQTRGQIEETDAAEGRQNLARLALNLAAQANASRVLAEKIALLLQRQEQAEKETKK